MKFLATLVAALLAAMTGWPGAQAAEITHFAFSCETPEGAKLKPKFGDIGGVFYTDLPAQRQQCLEAVKRKMALCRENTDFASNTKNEKYAECLPIFREQAKACVGHFQHERVKCDGSGGESTDAAPLKPFGPNWIVAENQPCQLHNPYPVPGETVTWSGGCVNGKASGKGRHVWRTSKGESVYEGGMHDGKMHGYGILTRPNGGRYEGEVRDGKLHGHGTYTWASGSRYEGEWRDTKRHGHGTFTRPDGSRYEGAHRDGKEHGHGTFTFPDGSRYEGEVRDGRAHGHGTLAFANGSRYEGEVRDGRAHGYGTITWDGGRYEGEIRDGVFHGQGTYTSPDGNARTCEWRDGRSVSGTCDFH